MKVPDSDFNSKEIFNGDEFSVVVNDPPYWNSM